jgi:tRNA-splicing ligase RtcB (3'-phosphate/5'-hydroxy nucleic acid ligase)
MIKIGKNCKVFTDNVEESALETIDNLVDSGAFSNSKIRIMPDVHDGKGIVIGFTAELKNLVNPCHVGVDIGCCIDNCVTSIRVEKATNEKLVQLEESVRKAIPFGFHINDHCIVDKSHFLKRLNECVAGWSYNWDKIEKKEYTLSDITELCKRISLNEDVFWNSLGTLGGGNHFIEFGNCKGFIGYTIHCGSRNLGVKIANYHCAIAENVSKNKSDEYKKGVAELIDSLKSSDQTDKIQDEIARYKKEFSKKYPAGYLYGKEMNDYLNDMVVATFYSIYNHNMISMSIHTCMVDVFNEHFGLIDYIRSMHNYIDMEDHIIRKGAVRAHKNEWLIVPLNMRDGTAICVGKGNQDWNCSCSHGAGRKMSRSEAKKTLSLDDFKKQMSGIVSISVCEETIDEAPDAYKDSKEILELIKPTCEVSYIIKPLINLKSKEA